MGRTYMWNIGTLSMEPVYETVHSMKLPNGKIIRNGNCFYPKNDKQWGYFSSKKEFMERYNSLTKEQKLALVKKYYVDMDYTGRDHLENRKQLQECQLADYDCDFGEYAGIRRKRQEEAEKKKKKELWLVIGGTIGAGLLIGLLAEASPIFAWLEVIVVILIFCGL